MKKQIIAVICVFGVATSFAQETSAPQPPPKQQAIQSESTQKAPKKGKKPGYTSRDATVLSMMGWGISIAVGIAAFCALMENDIAKTTTSTGT